MSHIEKLFISRKEKTFQFDDDLPSLPVPTLENTLRKYLDSVKPHLSYHEYQVTEDIVKRFEQGIGRELHEKLIKKAKAERNWLEKWWEDYAYLMGRVPVGPLMNFSGPGPYIDHVWPPKEGTQIERTAISTYYTLVFWKLLRKEMIKPDKAASGTRFSMNTYRRLFNSFKTPGETIDKLNFHFKTESEGKCPTHIVVLHKGRIFSFNAVDDNEDPLTVPELQSQLQYIHDKCEEMGQGPSVGILTADERTSWAKNRQYLQELSSQNARSLDIIDKSILAIVMDDSLAYDFTDIMRESLCGDCNNRWFDKSVSFITYRNGTIGSNCDHAPMDAMVAVSMTYFIDLNIKECGGKWKGTTVVRNLPKPEEISFRLDGTMYKAIDRVRHLHKKHCDSIECYNPIFWGFGKKYFRSQKVHPDATTQLAIQLAYYKMNGKPAPTYETATTRQFYHARTETVRSCTMESLEWSKAMLDPSITSKQRLDLFHKALKKHNTLMTEAQKNEGCDRHLLGLYILALEDGLETPEIYTDKAWTKSGGGGNYILSTSFVGYTTVGGGVAPMCDHGYGIFYRMLDDRIIFFICSWVKDTDTNSHLFFQHVQESLKEIKELLDVPQTTSARL